MTTESSIVIAPHIGVSMTYVPLKDFAPVSLLTRNPVVLAVNPSLGIDTLSVDRGNSKTQAVHQYTLAHSVYHLENVANLDRVPDAGAVVVVAPMKLEGEVDGPVRILALTR